jgi:hypothetical protein
MCCRESKRICIIDYRIEHMENHMEDNDIPKFRTYRGEIEFEGTLIQADIFIDNKMLEDRNSFLISFLCKSNKMYKMICRNVLKKEGYYINLKLNGVKLKTRVLSVSQSFIDSNSETYRIGLMCSNDLRMNREKGLLVSCGFSCKAL